VIDAATRRLVRIRAAFRCEYCRIHEDDEPYAFHVEHIVPHKHGGSDHPSNLAWSCQSCNLGKSSNLSGWVQGQIVALFDPRRRSWKRHFAWRGAKLVGRTKCGRATIQVLNINAEDRISLRQLLIELGDFPP
jgi:5-methylcytosine-specific restriction endonuclease McrA